MSQDRESYRRAKAELMRLLALAPTAREAHLAALDADDAVLASQVRALYASSCDVPTVKAAAQAAPEELELASLQKLLPPELTLERVLGRGGMGVVFLALRRGEGFTQQVALKILGLGLLSAPGALGGFLAERAILAALQHPNIARFLDGGTTTDGRPYLVLDYIEGTTLMAWVGARAPDLPTRIRLFNKICSAVQHAHQQLIVHRDLKPANILVDASGEPKLLDFGIARLLPTGRDATVTALGMRAMTMRYASPEQIRGATIGTASDVYTLGVVLCELLCGALPYRGSATTDLDIARAICEEPPLAPSTVIRAAGQTHKGIDTRQLRRELAGDLDEIVLKALRKEPHERYISPSALADDLERFLAGKPVLARQGSRLYHARKFIGRNLFAVAAAALAVALTVAFAIDRQRQLTVTRSERDRAEQSLTLLRDVLTSASPQTARGKELSAREILEAGAAKLEQDTQIDASVRVELLRTLGDIERELGLHDNAERHLAAAAQIGARLDPAELDHVTLNRVMLLNTRGQSQEAERLSAQLLARVDQGIDGLEDEQRATLMISRAAALHVLGRGEDALAVCTRALAALPDTPDGRRRRLDAIGQMGQILQNLGRLDAAEDYLRQTLQLGLELKVEPLRTSRDQNNLAGVLSVRGRFREALALHRASLPPFIEALGTTSPEYALRLNNLGMTEFGAGELAPALTHLADAVELGLARYGADNHLALVLQSNHAMVLAAAGELARADALAAAALVGLRAKLAAASLPVNRAERTAGIVALELGDLERARRHFSACVDGLLASKLQQNPMFARCRIGLADVALANNLPEQAGALLAEVRAQQREALDPRHPENGLGLLVLARWQLAKGSPDDALKSLQQIHHEALNEPWQAPYRDALATAANGDCAGFRKIAANLANRYPPDHPRWRGGVGGSALCADAF